MSELERGNSLGGFSSLLRLISLIYIYNKIMSISQIQIKSLEHLLARRQDVTANTSLPVGLPDSAAYYFFKEASFLSKKEEHWFFYFFQGLNTNPQNLSIFLRDEAQRENKNRKEKLVKGVFVVFDLFSKADVVVQINIPGNLKIYKIIGHKKQLVSNEEMDLMYLSSAFRAAYQNNLIWGRSFLLFHDSKNYIEDLRSFLNIAFRCLLKRDINLGPEFQSEARVKGSHACSLIFSYLKERKLVRPAIELIEDLLGKNQDFARCPKYEILLSQCYMDYGKPSKSLQIILTLLNSYPKEAFIKYYQAKYLLESGLCDQALLVANSIVQYNQFQIWLLLSEIHLQLKNFGDVLICLNHAAKMSKIKAYKHMDWSKSFEQLGKIKLNSSADGIEHNPKLLVSTDSPLNIMVKEVEEKNKFMIERGYWKLNQNQKAIYNIIQDVRYKLDIKKFQELLMKTFEDNIMKFQQVSIKKGMAEPAGENPSAKLIQESSKQTYDEEAEDLPEFLKNSIDKVEESVSMKPSRNLSIIPEIESVIQNSNYQEREKDKTKRHIKLKREVSEVLFRIIQMILAEGDFQKAEYQNNIAKILQVYNKMRTSSKFNTYYADLMFKIFMQTANYKSIIVLIAETLDFLEHRGVRKMDKLPYWMHKYLLFIIEEKGLKFFNDMLEKLNFYDEAIVDTIEIAKKWRMKGVTY